MSITPEEDEIEFTEDPVIMAVLGYVECLRDEFTEICAAGWSVDEAFFPFRPDDEDECEDEDEDGECSILSLRITGIEHPDIIETFGGVCMDGETVVNLELVILRCFPLHEDGEAPTATEVTAASMEAAEDRARAIKAISCCGGGIFTGIQSWSPIGPQGGQFGGRLLFSISV